MSERKYRPELSGRSIPRSVADVLARLEAIGHEVVTRSMLSEVLTEVGSDLHPDDAARILLRNGWFLPLRTQGAWEFAPAHRGGPIRAECPWLEVKATAATKPELEVAVGYEGAAFLHGFVEHALPESAIVAAKTARRPTALSGFRWVALGLPRSAILEIRNTPTLTVEAMLFAVAARPAAVHDWDTAGKWLRQAAHRATDTIHHLLEQAGTSVTARVGHILYHFGRDDMADSIADAYPPPTGPVHLGERSGGRYDPRFQVVDSVLGEG